MREELKACPFCGGTDVLSERGGVHCEECGARVGAAAAWNRREPDYKELAREMAMDAEDHSLEGMELGEDDHGPDQMDALIEEANQLCEKTGWGFEFCADLCMEYRAEHGYNATTAEMIAAIEDADRRGKVSP